MMKNIKDSIEGVEQQRIEQEARAKMRKEQGLDEKTSPRVCIDEFDGAFVPPDEDTPLDISFVESLKLPLPDHDFAREAVTILAPVSVGPKPKFSKFMEKAFDPYEMTSGELRNLEQPG